jgi:hypothetical protein
MKNFNMGIEISPQKIFTDTSVKFDAAIKLNRDRRLEPAKEIIIALLDGFYSRTQEQKNSTNAWS